MQLSGSSLSIHTSANLVSESVHLVTLTMTGPEMCSTLLWRQPLSYIADRSDKVGGPEWQVLCHCNHLHDPDSDNNNGGGHNMSTAPASCGLCTCFCSSTVLL